MKLYSIPALLCPFPIITSPHEDLIEAHTLNWLVELDLVKGSEQLAHYKNQRFATMIAKSYPYSALTDLFYWCDFNSLLFLIDDQLDEQNTITDKRGFFDFITELINVIEKDKLYVRGKDNPVFCALSDFWKNMQSRSSTAWKNKFVQGMKDVFFVGGVWAFEHISNNRKPSLQEYFLLRPFLGATNLTTDSLEVTGQVDLPPEIYNHPMIQRLTSLCRSTTCWSNDLFSLSKELQYNADFNLVCVLASHYDISIEEAIMKVVQIHDEEVREFISLSKRVETFIPHYTESVRKYISALECIMSGNIEWSTQATTRYPHIYLAPAEC